MHLLQSKRRSRATGGPQYWLQDITKDLKLRLRADQAVPVALVTPYGATPSTFRAVWKNAKLTAEGKTERANAQHDRIQQAGAGESIGEAIRYWYKLKSGDFERIDIEIQVLDDKFYVSPIGYKYAGRPKPQPIKRSRKRSAARFSSWRRRGSAHLRQKMPANRFRGRSSG